MKIWVSFPIIWVIIFYINTNYVSTSKTLMYCISWDPPDNCRFHIILEYTPLKIVYPCLLSNLNCTEYLLCLYELLWGTVYSVFLEAVSLGDFSLVAGEIDMKSLEGESLGSGSLMWVGDGFGLCLRSLSPVSLRNYYSWTGILGCIWSSWFLLDYRASVSNH